MQIPKSILFLQFHIDRVYANLKEDYFFENHYQPENMAAGWEVKQTNRMNKQ